MTNDNTEGVVHVTEDALHGGPRCPLVLNVAL